MRFASSLNLCLDFPNLKATDAKSDHMAALERKDQEDLCTQIDQSNLCLSLCLYLWVYFVLGKEREEDRCCTRLSRALVPALQWQVQPGHHQMHCRGNSNCSNPINLCRAAGAPKLIQLQMKLVHHHCILRQAYGQAVVKES